MKIKVFKLGVARYLVPIVRYVFVPLSFCVLSAGNPSALFMHCNVIVYARPSTTWSIEWFVTCKYTAANELLESVVLCLRNWKGGKLAKNPTDLIAFV